jgi:hypothetical protein
MSGFTAGIGESPGGAVRKDVPPFLHTEVTEPSLVGYELKPDRPLH